MKKLLFITFLLLQCFMIYAGTDDYLHTQGTKILDAQGREVWLTGVNWFGFETATMIFHGLWNRDLESVLEQITDMGFNVMRVPLHLAEVLDWKHSGGGFPPSIMIMGDINPYLEGATTLDILDHTVNYCETVGLKIIFDMHSLDPDGYHYNLWYNGSYSLNDLIEGWEYLAQRYNNNDTIIGFDLKNEPHGAAGEGDNAAKWDNSQDPNNWKNAAEKIAGSILDINPNLLIFVEGVQYHISSEPNVYDMLGLTFPSWEDPTVHNYWWGGNFMGVEENPIDLGSHADKLIYSPHDYGPSVWTQPWFEPEVFSEANMHKVWDHYWFYIQKNNIAPLFIGEWGGKMNDQENVKWMTYLKNLIIENRINHTFWCFNENSGDTGGLVTGAAWDGVDEEKYNFIEPTLWQDSAGRYIGLDHDVPLGSNGISLNEYFSNPTPAPTPTPVAATPTPQTGMKGDSNGSGTIDIVDALMTAQFYVGLNPPGFNEANADVNCDGTVTIVDALIIAQYYVGLIEKFC